MYISGEENRIEGCEIAYAATGVMLDGRNHVIRNCSITDIYGGDYFSSIYIAPFFPVDGIGPNHDAANVSCGGHLIERNTLARASRGFINIAEKTGGKGTTYQKIRILYNDMSDYMLNTEDGGSVYQWCVNGSGTEVAYNWIHGDHGNYAFNPALYADNDCLNFRYHHNVIWDVKLGIGWNQTSGYLEAYNNTVWARDLGAKNEAIKVTVAVPGCKIFNNLANQTIGGAGPASSQTNNLVVGGGFAGNPNHPASGLDFILASNSPAINAGMVITGVTDRAVGAPDVGAYEFGGPEWTAGAGTEPVAPTAPIEFGATAIGAQGIRLGWTDVAFNEKAYVLERSTDGKSWATVANLPANAFTYLDAGFHLKAGTGYQYRLAATNDYGSSAWVSIKTATPTAAKVPAITSALTAKGVQGVTFTYTILAANDPAEVTAEGLPKGLAFNPATGVIAGYAETAGEAKVNLTATNAKGTDTKTLTLTIAKSELVAIKGGTVSEYADLPAPPGVGGQAGAAGVRWTVLIFTNNGSFAVSGGPAEYLIVAGGGGGGARGGGGAGGVLTGSVNSISGEHKVTVGGGGGFGTNGEPSSISGPVICWTAAGGGYGGTWNQNGGDGGSGGGGGSGGPIPLKTGGTSVYPLMFAGQEAYAVKQGNRGGNGLGDNYRGAGGGGAGGVGGDDDRSSSQCAGGPGISSTLGDGKTVVRYAAGGGGGGNGPKGLGGSGIGGDAAEAKIAATDGKPNTGSGGGAGGGKGGSGIVIVRFVRTGM
jgi:hypothetical protein